MRKTAIIFPGIGYHTDKPLLYFSKKLARENGYEIIEVPYGGFSSGIKGNKEKMQEAFNHAFTQTKEVLKDQVFSADDDILVISKSIGTIVAAAWQKELGLPARNIYFTPLAETFLFTRLGSGIAFHGTKDPWADSDVIADKCQQFQIPLYCVEKANHSLERDAISDLKMLKKVMARCQCYIAQES